LADNAVNYVAVKGGYRKHRNVVSGISITRNAFPGTNIYQKRPR